MQVQQQYVKIQGKGLVTIPKVFRDDLELEKDSLARIIKVNGRLVIEPVRALPYKVRSYTAKNIAEFLDLDKRETKELRSKGLL